MIDQRKFSTIIIEDDVPALPMSANPSKDLIKLDHTTSLPPSVLISIHSAPTFKSNKSSDPVSNASTVFPWSQTGNTQHRSTAKPRLGNPALGLSKNPCTISKINTIFSVPPQPDGSSQQLKCLARDGTDHLRSLSAATIETDPCVSRSERSDASAQENATNEAQSQSCDGTILRDSRGSHRERIVITIDDEEVERFTTPVQIHSAPGQSTQPNHCFERVFIDLDAYDERPSPEPLQTSRKSKPEFRRKPSGTIHPLRNPQITLPWHTIDSIQHAQLSLRPFKTVELKTGEFLRITTIVQHSITNEVLLRGHTLQRCSSLNGLLERKLNELCLSYEVDLDDPRPAAEQCIVSVPLSDVLKIRQVRWTNQPFPRKRNLVLADWTSQEQVASEAGLTCRWRYICKYESAGARTRNEWTQKVLEHFMKDEVSESSLRDEERRNEWRGETVPGGAWFPGVEEEGIVGNGQILRGESIVGIADRGLLLDLKSETSSTELSETTQKRKLSTSASSAYSARKRLCYEEDGIEETMVNTNKENNDTIFIPKILPQLEPGATGPITQPITKPDIPSSGVIELLPGSSLRSTSKAPGQMLTYGDAFCGGGGSTRGAAMAGLKVKWGFDSNAAACSTWHLNFPLAQCFNLSSHQFVSLAQDLAQQGQPDAFKVDILHLSPPCQFFSAAHTVDGKNDEANVASLFAVRSVIELSRPRVVTLEQTFGITRVRFVWYLAALLQMFTALGFSVRWKIANLAHWGLPQRRRRLIIIASCPGEGLPEFPADTHGDGIEGLKPFATVNNTLAEVRLNAPNHEPVMWAEHRREKPWDGNAVLPRAMTTNGGQNYHPSGLRDLTLREYAGIQGFPPNHLFQGAHIKRLIGNAVPPLAAKVLFESIKKELDRRDGFLDERETIVVD